MTQITISRDQVMQLLALAAEALDVRHSEFSSYPIMDERELMLSVYRLADEKVPPDVMVTLERAVQPIRR